MDYLIEIIAVIAGPLLLLCATAFALRMEGVRPVAARDRNGTELNLKYTLIFSLIQTLINPLLAGVIAIVTNALGYGIITLPSVGWMVIPAFFLYLLVMDFMEFLFHRAQHKFAFLWAMHSLHHSDTTLNASSTSRHFWAEPSIKTVTVYLFPAFLFKSNGTILTLYAILSMYNIFLHMNIRVGFGSYSIWLNAPQYHRLHHSSLAEHYNCNFAALFPVWDRIFGSFQQPKRDEYPPTGIEHSEQPANLLEALAWPVRSLLKRRGSRINSMVRDAD